MINKAIYFDYNSTTPVDEQVVLAMQPYFTTTFGNPSNQGHTHGWLAASASNQARKKVAAPIKAKESEIYWTSGATESNNLCLLGYLYQLLETHKAKDIHFITSTIEHKSVLKVFQFMEKQFKISVSYVECDSCGQVHPDALEKLINKNTKLISIMAANNEIGTINPIKEIGALCKKHQILFHTDAAQAYGKWELDVTECGIDFLSLSAHKIYGPKGVGALYIREGVKIKPILMGGGQEKDLRSGTLNVPAIVGLGVAAEIAQKYIESESKHLHELQDMILNELVDKYPDYIQLNGDRKNRITTNIHLSFKNISMGLIKSNLQNFALSSGSACNSKSQAPSHVLQAIHIDEGIINNSIRIGLGRQTTKAEVLALIAAVEKTLLLKINN